MSKFKNKGEISELLLKIYLIYLRDFEPNLETPFGPITSVGFTNEYKKLNFNINFNNLIDLIKLGDFQQLKEISELLEIEKSSSLNKADVFINNYGVSTKFMGGAKPALVNHTSREKWLRISEEINYDISILDNLINLYWNNIENKIHPKDIKNSNPSSPFYNALEDLRPILNYYSFLGSGKKRSKFPAYYIMDYKMFNDVNTWNIYNENNFLDNIWNKLVFSFRSDRGMDKYFNVEQKEKIEPWTREINNRFLGAFHIRISK